MNRRNALLGLGAIATGGGALFGSGAFSQVTADRTVSLSATKDSQALLAFKQGTGATGIVNTKAAGGSSNTIVKFNSSNLNSDAVTTWNGALQVKNKGADPIKLKVQEEPNEDNSNDWLGSASSEELDFKVGGSSIVASQTSTINVGDSVYVTIEVDLTGSNKIGDIPSSPNNIVTFVANSQ